MYKNTMYSQKSLKCTLKVLIKVLYMFCIFIFLYFRASCMLKCLRYLNPNLPPSPPGWLKVFAMKHGVVGIRGVKSGLYLCMSAQGRTYGAVSSSTCPPLSQLHAQGQLK